MFTKTGGINNDHQHRIDVDGQGTGSTIDTTYGKPHSHDIKDWVVAESDTEGVEPHTHEIDRPEATIWSAGDKPKVIDETSPRESFSVEVKVTIPEGKEKVNG